MLWSEGAYKDELSEEGAILQEVRHGGALVSYMQAEGFGGFKCITTSQHCTDAQRMYISPSIALESCTAAQSLYLRPSFSTGKATIGKRTRVTIPDREEGVINTRRRGREKM